MREQLFKAKGLDRAYLFKSNSVKWLEGRLYLLMHDIGVWQECEPETLSRCVMEDQNRINIFEDMTIFEFDYLVELHETVRLSGSFRWHQDGLKYDIELFGSDTYEILSFNQATMTNFLVIGDVVSNKELVEESHSG